MPVGTTITPAMVKDVINTNLSDSQIEASIATSETLYLSAVGASGSENLEREIKIYLAAHFVTAKDRSTSVVEEKIGDAAVKYADIRATGSQKKQGGLDSTVWGQTAIMLDTSGKLSRIGLLPPRWFSL